MYTNPPRQPCGCHAPHVLCPTGADLQRNFFNLHFDVDNALAAHDLKRYNDACRMRAEAEAAYLRHIGMVMSRSSVLDMAIERVLTRNRTFPAECAIIVAELKRLYEAAGEPIPALLGDREEKSA